MKTLGLGGSETKELSPEQSGKMCAVQILNEVERRYNHTMKGAVHDYLEMYHGESGADWDIDQNGRLNRNELNNAVNELVRLAQQGLNTQHSIADRTAEQRGAKKAFNTQQKAAEDRLQKNKSAARNAILILMVLAGVFGASKAGIIPGLSELIHKANVAVGFRKPNQLPPELANQERSGGFSLPEFSMDGLRNMIGDSGNQNNSAQKTRSSVQSINYNTDAWKPFCAFTIDLSDDTRKSVWAALTNKYKDKDTGCPSVGEIDLSQCGKYGNNDQIEILEYFGDKKLKKSYGCRVVQ